MSDAGWRLSFVNESDLTLTITEIVFAAPGLITLVILTADTADIT